MFRQSLQAFARSTARSRVIKPPVSTISSSSVSKACFSTTRHVLKPEPVPANQVNSNVHTHVAALGTDYRERTRAEVLSVVKGQLLRIPDIDRLFDGWPRPVNPYLSSVTDGVNEILHKYTVSPKILAKLTGNKLDVLVATWFPLASAERLKELSLFVCWMFIIDDEIDSMANVSVGEFKHLWTEALRVISESCGLHGHQGGTNFRESHFKSCEAFRPFGELLMDRYSTEQRQRFWDELSKTADSYIAEHEFTKMDRIPSYDAYCMGRYGSSCMAQILSMIEYSNDSNIPQEIMESPELKTLWKETVDLLWIDNDIVSFKKEIAEDFMENLVLIASKPDYNLQNGLDHCIARMTSAVSKVNAAAAVLKEKHLRGNGKYAITNKKVARDLENFIMSCRAISVGTYEWSRSTPRYAMLHNLRAPDGSITFRAGDPASV